MNNSFPYGGDEFNGVGASSSLMGDSDGDSTPDHYSIPEGMTEEEAMAIWLRRDAEIDERLRRERELRRELESSGRDEGPPRPPPTPLPSLAPNFHSAAWRDALASNPISPHDPSQRDAFIAYQRFINLNRPGLADAYVPSTPGLARMVELEREERRREQEAAMAAEQAARRRQLEEAIEAQQRLMFASARQPQAHNGSPREDHAAWRADAAPAGSRSDSAITAQVMEYERLYRAHHSRAAQGAHDVSSSPPISMITTATDNVSDLPSDSSRLSSPGNNRNGNEDKDKDKGKNSTCAFHLATPYPTEQLTTNVTCNFCHLGLFTNPLAQSFFCQVCCQISLVPKVQGGEGKDDGVNDGMDDDLMGGRARGGGDDRDAAFEEKMMDV